MNEKTFLITATVEIDLPEGACVDDSGTAIILADGRRLSAFIDFDVEQDGEYFKLEEASHVDIACGDLQTQIQEAEYGN